MKSGPLVSLSTSLVVIACSTTAVSFAAEKPPTGEIATLLRKTPLFVAADTSSQQIDRISPGRELLITEHSGPWLRVLANTDVEKNRAEDAPVFGSDAETPPLSGWVKAQGVVSAATPKGDLVLFGEASANEQTASEAQGERTAAQSARLLYTRAAEIFPSSAIAPEAAWRAADIRWQLEKADVFSRPSAHEKESYLRQQINDDEMRKIEKQYPGSKWSDLAAWDMLDNKVCGDWQGSTKCPEMETGLYQKYADDHPNSPKAAEALYDATYRQAAVGDIEASDGNEKKAEDARARAQGISERLEAKYPSSDYAARGATLIYKVQQHIPIYGTAE